MSEFHEVTNIRDGQTIITEIKTIYYQAQVSALNSFIQIGQKLLELKEMIPHGRWSEYVKDNLGWNERKAQRFMQLADGYSEGTAYANLISNPSFLSDLNMTNALALLAIPEDEVAEFAEEHVKEDTTNKELAQEIKKYKEENTGLTEQVSSLEKEIERMRASAEEGISKEDYEKVKEDCDKLKAKLEKTKEKLKKEQAAKSEVESKAKQEAMAEIENKVREENEETIRQLEQNITELEEACQIAERKAENAANSSIVEFKMYCDHMQNDFDEALNIIEQTDEIDSERAEKMLKALDSVTDYMANAIANPEWRA